MILNQTDLKGTLPLLARGKVRDLYSLPSSSSLLFVATDRISAYDVIMENGIPSKGKLLTALSLFWFSHLSSVCPNHLLPQTHTLASALPEKVQPYLNQLEGRSMVVRKLKIFPVEAIVRGYITGSAWKEYAKTGTVHGIALKDGLQESEKFEQPLFTPSTKAEQGAHDENIHPSALPALVGAKYAARITQLSLALYTQAHAFALARGIIIADTKFEFGLDEESDEVVLVDEVLTPDSSRFWSKEGYAVGRAQESYDKQYLRDWLTAQVVAGKEGVSVPEDVVRRTGAKYKEAYEGITGKTWME